MPIVHGQAQIELSIIQALRIAELASDSRPDFPIWIEETNLDKTVAVMRSGMPTALVNRDGIQMVMEDGD